MFSHRWRSWRRADRRRRSDRSASCPCRYLNHKFEIANSKCSIDRHRSVTWGRVVVVGCCGHVDMLTDVSVRSAYQLRSRRYRPVKKNILKHFCRPPCEFMIFFVLFFGFRCKNCFFMWFFGFRRQNLGHHHYHYRARRPPSPSLFRANYSPGKTKSSLKSKKKHVFGFN